MDELHHYLSVYTILIELTFRRVDVATRGLYKVSSWKRLIMQIAIFVDFPWTGLDRLDNSSTNRFNKIQVSIQVADTNRDSWRQETPQKLKQLTDIYHELISWFLRASIASYLSSSVDHRSMYCGQNFPLTRFRNCVSILTTTQDFWDIPFPPCDDVRWRSRTYSHQRFFDRGQCYVI